MPLRTEGARGAMLAMIVFAGAALRSPAASAEPTRAELDAARQLFFEGVAAQEARRYDDALERYARVRAIVVSPTLLFNIGTCEERRGRLRAASAVFEEALRLAHERADWEVEREAQKGLEKARRDTPKVLVRLAAGTESPRAELDGRELDAASLAELPVDPGRHRLVVRSEKHERVFELDFEIARAATREVDVDLGPRGRPPPAPVVEWRTIERASPAPALRPSYLPAALAGGAAVLFGAGAIVTGVLGADRQDEYAALNARPTPDNRAAREDLRSEGTTLYAANAVSLGVAAVATALAVYFLVRPPVAPARSAQR